MAKKKLSEKEILALLDDPQFHLAVAEYPTEHQDEIDAIDEYIRRVTPSLAPWVSASNPAETRIVGKRVKRVEDPVRLTGQAMYATDVSLPGMLHAAILRSPHARARIEDIDTSAAEALPGVRAVLTYKNVPTEGGAKTGSNPDRYAVQRDVNFAGEEVAAVAAEDAHTAREALDLIKIKWNVLPSITDMKEALLASAPDLAGTRTGNKTPASAPTKRGDFAAAYASAPIKHEGTYTTTTLQHATLEPYATVVRWDAPDHVTAWASTQYAPGIRSGLAGYFGLPRARVRAIAENTGGGFGSKTGANRDAIIAAVLSKMTLRPVKVAFDRPGNFKAATHRFADILTLKAGVTSDGRLVAYEGFNYGDAAAYRGGASAIVPLQRLYRADNATFTYQGVITNRPPSGAQRCVGDPQGTWAQEIFIDELAEKAGMDPVAFRLKNFETKIDQDTKRTWASCGIVECVEQGAKAIGWQQKWHKPGAAIRGSKAHGIGMAAHACAHGAMSLPMSSVVRIDQAGAIDINQGLTEIGGGQSTTMMMIATETVGASLKDAYPTWGDTGFVSDTGGTWGSRGTISAGSAVRNAALDLKAQLLVEATKPRGSSNKPLLEGKPEDLDTADGYAFLKADPSKRVALKDIVSATGSPMMGRGTHVVPAGVAMSVFAAGFAEVEVDLDTGEITLLRYIATDDLGKAINVLGAEQQIEGGASMGIGMALGEELKFDGPGNFPVNANWENYAMPTALDHPRWADFRPILVEPGDAIGPYGAKGLAEPPTAPPPPAIANAVYNAIGVRIHDAPITSDKILAGIKEKGLRA
ncbi:MAG TPA: xanthine dehydrogenase family protein molybdopterin-binding subunit [Candidatus Limnocylindria bacterium]|nr:xanthine dehydrogenase family protein molybdopterin-binding subunit [Candidatus Limnocylindria bacterium]